MKFLSILPKCGRGVANCKAIDPALLICFLILVFLYYLPISSSLPRRRRRRRRVLK